MTCLTSHQLRALSAAAGVVGRETLRAGLLLTLACAPAPADTTDAQTTGDPATTSGTTSAAITSSTSTTDAQTTSGATGDASTGDTTTTGDDPTTGGATLLTEFTTTGETGDLTTSTTDTTEATGTTGGLDDCLDPRTLEVDWVCCEAQNWLPSPQCTPWGPPAPPATSRDLLARARAARLELV